MKNKNRLSTKYLDEFRLINPRIKLDDKTWNMIDDIMYGFAKKIQTDTINKLIRG